MSYAALAGAWPFSRAVGGLIPAQLETEGLGLSYPALVIVERAGAAHVHAREL